MSQQPYQQPRASPPKPQRPQQQQKKTLSPAPAPTITLPPDTVQEQHHHHHHANGNGYILPQFNELNNYTPTVPKRGWWKRRWDDLFGNKNPQKTVEINRRYQYETNPGVDGNMLESWESPISLSRHFREQSNSRRSSAESFSLIPESPSRSCSTLKELNTTAATTTTTTLPGVNELSHSGGNTATSFPSNQQQKRSIDDQYLNTTTPVANRPITQPTTPHQHESNTPFADNFIPPQIFQAPPVPKCKTETPPAHSPPIQYKRQPTRPAPVPIMSTSSPTGGALAFAAPTPTPKSTGVRPSPPRPVRSSSGSGLVSLAHETNPPSFTAPSAGPLMNQYGFVKVNQPDKIHTPRYAVPAGGPVAPPVPQPPIFKSIPQQMAPPPPLPPEPLKMLNAPQAEDINPFDQPVTSARGSGASLDQLSPTQSAEHSASTSSSIFPPADSLPQAHLNESEQSPIPSKNRQIRGHNASELFNDDEKDDAEEIR